MNRNVSAQISYDRLNKGVDIRNPSTSNFLVSSTDRDPYIGVYSTGPYLNANAVSNPCNFTITKKNSLFSGFFTRAAISEVDMWWNKFNISPIAGAGQWNGNQAGTYYGTNTFSVVVPSVGAGAYKTFTMPPGFYNVEQCLDTMVLLLNQASPTGYGAGFFDIGDADAQFPNNLVSNCKTIETTGGQTFYFVCESIDIGINTYPVRGLADMLSFPTYLSVVAPASPDSFYYCSSPNLQAYPFIDFTSTQMTAVQDIKDTSTGQTNVESLYRWVFGNDGDNIYDNYGYPILQGYRPFKQRRPIAFPKQVRMDPLLPIGQVNFTLLDMNGNPLTLSQAEQLEYNMLMLISEV
jgi:hypothetical protein